jgi:hypothetical protein
MEVESVEAQDRLDDESFHGWISQRMGVQSLTAKVRWCEEAVEVVAARLARGKSTRSTSRMAFMF